MEEGVIGMVRGEFYEILELLEKDKKIYEIMEDCPYQILKSMKLRKYGAGEFVLNQGETYDVMHLIVEGEADIFVESEQGKKYYLASYGRGSFIGELELFNRKPYMSYVESRNPIVTLELERNKFLRWLECDRHFNYYFMNFLSSECYESMQKMGKNTLYTLKQRICQFLIDNMDEHGKQKKNMSAEILSERMGVTSRSVHRILKDLKDKGIIEINKSNVIIMDFEQLQKEKDEK